MDCQIPPIYLPILRKENVVKPSKKLPEALYIWPGFENIPNGYWQPNHYPFAPKLAKACFDDLCNMSEAALFGMPIHSLIGGQDEKNEVKNIEERDQLAHFANTGEKQENSAANDLHTLQAAQKIILWAWLLEERHYEINDLTSTYAKSMQGFANALGVEQDEDFGHIGHIETSLDASDAPLPPWKIVLENVAVFLPENCSIVVNHEDMAAHILDICHDTKANSKGMIECHTDIGHILNKNERQKQACPWLQNKLNFIILEKI